MLDLGTRQAWRGERAIDFTAKEFDLLAAFLRQPRQVLSRDQLLDQVWGFDYVTESKVLEVYVRYLRDKLEVGGESRLIHGPARGGLRAEGAAGVNPRSGRRIRCAGS